MTSGKLSYSGSWEDAEFALEYVNNRYLVDPKTGKKRTRLYAYGVSLGAQILGLYLGKAGKKACSVVDAALMYATAWNYEHGHKYFYTNGFGLY